MKEKLRRAFLPAIVVVAIAWQYRAPLGGRIWFFEDIAAYFVPLYAAAGRERPRARASAHMPAAPSATCNSCSQA